MSERNSAAPSAARRTKSKSSDEEKGQYRAWSGPLPDGWEIGGGGRLLVFVPDGDPHDTWPRIVWGPPENPTHTANAGAGPRGSPSILGWGTTPPANICDWLPSGWSYPSFPLAGTPTHYTRWLAETLDYVEKADPQRSRWREAVSSARLLAVFLGSASAKFVSKLPPATHGGACRELETHRDCIPLVFASNRQARDPSRPSSDRGGPGAAGATLSNGRGKREYTKEEKKQLVAFALACLVDVGTYKLQTARIAKAIGVPRKTLEGWADYQSARNKDLVIAERARKKYQGSRAGGSDFSKHDQSEEE